MAQMSRQALLETASQFAAGLMREAKSNEEVLEALLDEGLNQGEAEYIVQHLLRIRAENMRREAKVQIGKGLILSFVAMFATLILDKILAGLGVIVGLIGIGFGLSQILQGNKKMQEADTIQASFPSRQSSLNGND